MGHGYDSPISSKDQDHLGRWAFASQIAHIASKAPRDWAVRIGVYGGWGEGKTSVLRLVEGITREDGHAVAWFNPWGCTSSADLWLSFVQSIAEAVRELGDPVLAGLGKQLDTSRIVKEINSRIEKNRHLLELGGAVAGAAVGVPIIAMAVGAAGRAASPLVGKWGSKKQRNIIDELAILGDKRLIVLIDDVDRADPRLLPQLLFALREVLDLGGFSFVLAIDADRVEEVLRKMYPGVNGREFLDKIVDFPRNLPVPSRSSMMALARTEARRRFPFVDSEALDSVLDFLPPNPRLVRQFVRQTWSLKPVVERSTTGEIHWEFLLLSQLIALSWPKLAGQLMADREQLAAYISKYREEMGKGRAHKGRE